MNAMPAEPGARIRARYLLETPLEIEAAVEVLAGEASTGTFVAIPGEDPSVRERFGMRLESVTPLERGVARPLAGRGGWDGDRRVALVDVGLPLELTGLDLVTVLASVAGNVTELCEVTALKLLDLQFPAVLAAASPRPALSIDGVRRIIGVHDRPLRVALEPATDADLLLDREIAADPPANPLERRLETARETTTALTITDEWEAMARHAERVEAAGGAAVQVALERTGVSAVSSLRRRTGLGIVGRPGGAAVHARCESGGVAFRAWQKLWRLAGVDVLPVPAWADDSAATACLAPLLDDGDRALPLVDASRAEGLGPDCAVLAEAMR